MSFEQRRLLAASYLLVAAIALTAATLALGASSDCLRFTLEDVFRCRFFGRLAGIADAVAAGSLALVVVGFPAENWPSPRPLLTVIGEVGAGIASVASMLLPVGPSERLFQVGACGWLVIGVWLFQFSRNGPESLRSTSGAAAGVTLVAWALFAVFNDDRPPFVGGSLFFILFAYWSIRAAWRIVRGHEPSAPAQHGWLSDIVVATLSAIGIVFIGLPLWLASTLGVTPIGDPSDTLVVRNDRSTPIVFYTRESDVGRYPGQPIATGGQSELSPFVQSTYDVVATDQRGIRVFCHTYTRRDLRALHWTIVVLNDPASCR